MTHQPADASQELTYSEEFILRGIREGRRDPEIAVGLGIAVGDVKARIERLSRRAGVGSREALGHWDPAAVVLPTPGEEPDSGVASQRAKRTVPWVPALAAVAMLAVAAAGLWLLIRDEGSDTPTAPTTAGSFDAAAALPVERLRFVASSEYPSDVLLYVLRGCESCAAPISLDRVYRDQFGEVRAETVFRLEAASGQYILSVWSLRDASDIVIAVCDKGTCGGARELTSDAMTRFHRSRDGGITWVDVGAVAGRARTVSGSSGELVLVRAEHEGILSYQVLGGDGTEDVSDLIPPGPPAEFTLIQRLDAETAQGLSKIATNVNGAFAYTWYLYSPSPDTDGVVTRLGVADRFGATTKMMEYNGAPLTLGAWLDATTVVGTVPQTPGVVLPGVAAPPRSDLPVLIDIVGETVISLPDPFTNTRYISATNEVVAAVRGEFVRVAAAPADCLTIYRFPRRESLTSACLKDGALVNLAESRFVVGEEWVSVVDQAHKTGWVRPEDLGALLEPR